MYVRITSHNLSKYELKNYLRLLNITFEETPTDATVRDMDSTVLLAVIGATSVVLRYFIIGLLDIIKERQLARLSIETKEGTKIDIPANYSIERVEKLITELQRLEVIKVTLD